MTQFLLWMRMRGSTERTVELWTGNIERFIGWSAERGIDCVSQVTPEILAAYRRALFHYRKAKTNKPLRFATDRPAGPGLDRKVFGRGAGAVGLADERASALSHLARPADPPEPSVGLG